MCTIRTSANTPSATLTFTITCIWFQAFKDFTHSNGKHATPPMDNLGSFAAVSNSCIRTTCTEFQSNQLLQVVSWFASQTIWTDHSVLWPKMLKRKHTGSKRKFLNKHFPNGRMGNQKKERLAVADQIWYVSKPIAASTTQNILLQSVGGKTMMLLDISRYMHKFGHRSSIHN